MESKNKTNVKVKIQEGGGNAPLVQPMCDAALDRNQSCFDLDPMQNIKK